MEKVVRANQNAVMIKWSMGQRYQITDLKTGDIYSGTLNAMKKRWNRHYRNSRQWVPKGNHRYLSVFI